MAKSIRPWQAKEIVEIVKAKDYFGEQNWEALEVSTDTRNISKGALFIALRGENFKGEDFLAQAKEKAAVAAIVQEINREISLPQIAVASSLQALADLAIERRQRSQAIVVGLTGSNGKTSTKEMLARIFSQAGETLFTAGNLNNDIGVPLTLLRLRDEHQFVIIEMGANHPSEIAYLAKIAQPNIALVTNVSAAHLEGFGSLEGVAQTKSELYKNSHEKIVINVDLPWANDWLAQYESRPKKTFSLRGNGDIVPSFISDDGRHFVVNIENQKMTVDWNLYGRHNVENALAACATAILAGLSIEHISAGLNGLSLKQSRLSVFSVNQHRIYDDTYNANPASFKAGIDVLASSTGGETLVIAGAMAELGENSAQLHQEVTQYAKKQGVTRFWSLNAKDYNAENFTSLEALAEALKNLLALESMQIILVKGSRSAAMERVFIAADLEKYRKG
ncbi:UDP-N-acetylmuramoyl-tripeptide--D-alanyl-D-alanine ligase [Suttonella ornithocola]|uniref:UDP-N-acetylmuramoyl-tripeptide--D-alanyl-D-alanine ligase n=1 Tax=Suttonella ornithocola TaxID=279832 RepID=A0A380MXF1_9GAMM|nr:UDP-N-acetylmuramoyl-tripeptide--D-alanyl-D-alanine ligase [Suttonella ornithocola]SUO97239.1 UDP-N-acetylmuramoyl-tripeptide--D-alanyl-D-alanine ligase [Suttonella ornithocola]